MQIPYVERPPGSPSILRQGQIASQLHDSRYVPAIDHVTRQPYCEYPARVMTRERPLQMLLPDALPCGERRFEMTAAALKRKIRNTPFAPLSWRILNGGA
jgi:hypothetical protein